MLTYFDYQTFWPVFPIGIAIATTAMSTGIDGAVFWSPVFIFLFGLPPEVAIACGIFIEVFGFGSGIYGYAIKKKILYKEMRLFLFLAVIFGLIGAMVSKILPQSIIFAWLGISAIFLFYVNIKKALKKKKIIKDYKNENVIKYKFLGSVLNSIGGFMTGLIGVGLGEVNNYYFLSKNKLSIPFASGNSVFLIAFTAFICSIFNVIYFSETLPPDKIKEVYSILIFAVPSVVIGARIGVLFAHSINPRFFYYFVAFLFIFIAGFSFYRTFS
jgi:hypothetical protein